MMWLSSRVVLVDERRVTLRLCIGGYVLSGSCAGREAVRGTIVATVAKKVVRSPCGVDITHVDGVLPDSVRVRSYATGQRRSATGRRLVVVRNEG